MRIAWDNEMSAVDLLRQVEVNWGRAVGHTDGASVLFGHDFDISPEEFLSFAKCDLASRDRSACVNALANCKRAIDCQVEKLLMCFGLPVNRRSVPAKITTMGQLGIVAPRILEKINRTRNYLEHEFKCPRRDKVEDAVDITELFLVASDRAINPFWDSFSIGDHRDHYGPKGHFHHCLVAYYRGEVKEFELRGYKEGNRVGCAVVNVGDRLYIPLVRISVALEQSAEAKAQAIAALDHFAPAPRRKTSATLAATVVK